VRKIVLGAAILFAGIFAAYTTTERVGPERKRVTERNELVLVGQTVEYVFLPGEPVFVSHAEFKLTNPDLAPATCTVVSCEFVENGRAAPLDVVHLYTDDRSLGRVIGIPAASDLDLRVTFPFREAHIGPNFTYAVVLKLECGGRRFEATCRLNVTQEKQ